MSEILRYDNFFEKEDWEEILEKFSQPKWQYGHRSHPPGHPEFDEEVLFWSMRFEDDPFFCDYLLGIIEEKTNQKYELINVYCNGNTFGQGGSFHQDWDDDQGRTFLLYANPYWKQEWGGKTVFKRGNSYAYSEFTPNSALLFPGIIPHRSEGPDRLFTGLRKTVTWKLVLKH